MFSTKDICIDCLYTHLYFYWQRSRPKLNSRSLDLSAKPNFMSWTNGENFTKQELILIY